MDLGFVKPKNGGFKAIEDRKQEVPQALGDYFETTDEGHEYLKRRSDAVGLVEFERLPVPGHVKPDGKPYVPGEQHI